MIRDPAYREAKALVRSVEAAARKAAKAHKAPRAKRIVLPKSEKADRGRVRDNAHLQFIRRLPCAATYVQTGKLLFGVDAAHVRFGDAHAGKPFTGGQVKPSDCWTVPLSRAAHEAQHRVNERAYWIGLGVDVLDLCRRLHAVSGDEAAGLAVIQSLRGQP